MRIDFNQKGSWRMGPDFDERESAQVMDVAEKFADFTNAKLRIVDANGEVVAYRDAGEAWRATKTRRQS